MVDAGKFGSKRQLLITSNSQEATRTATVTRFSFGALAWHKPPGQTEPVSPGRRVVVEDEPTSTTAIPSIYGENPIIAVVCHDCLPKSRLL